MGWIDDWGKFLNSKGQLILKKKMSYNMSLSIQT